MTKLLLIGGLLALSVACAGANAPKESSAVADLPGRAPPQEPVQRANPTSPESASPSLSRVTQVSILEPSQLRSLETRGFGIGKLVEGREARSTRELSALPGHRSIFRVQRKDLAEVVREYPTAIVSSVQGARLFEKKFLDSKSMSFALSGVPVRSSPPCRRR